MLFINVKCGDLDERIIAVIDENRCYKKKWALTYHISDVNPLDLFSFEERLIGNVSCLASDLECF